MTPSESRSSGPKKFYWPNGIPEEETIDAFVAIFCATGYIPCDSGKLEPDYEKVAIYYKSGSPTHAARQLPDGKWTSKLGSEEDIEHKTVGNLFSQDYGRGVLFLKKPVP